MNKNSLYINRDIAWLSFNERVLQEAADPSNPIIERMIFLGIFSNNNDEFFRVRVATLKRMEAEDEKNQEIPKLLKQVRNIVNKQLQFFEKVYDQNIKELKKNQIYLVDNRELNAAQGRYVRDYFHMNVRQYIYPIFLDKIDDVKGVNDKSNFLAVRLGKKGTEIKKDMVIELPVSKLSRFLVLPERRGKRYFMLLDDVVRYCLSDIFSSLGYNTYNAYTFKFIRDSELNMEEQSSADLDREDFLDLLGDKIKERNVADVVRFVHQEYMPKDLVEDLRQLFSVTAEETFNSRGRYQNKKDFVAFPKSLGFKKDLRMISKNDLIYPAFEHKELNCLMVDTLKFEVIKQRDIMLHYPYQSFQHLIDFLREASMDPQVESIKMTIYRVASDSSIMNALINAARNGKKVSVFMEVMARFDEKNNINWVKRLEAENIFVYPIIFGVKVHSKLLLITRKEEDKKLRYAVIGTGNFNEQTAKLYVDKQLFTIDKRITNDVKKVFKKLEKPEEDIKFDELLLSPVQLRKSFEDLIEQETTNALLGKPAWIKACMNSLADYKMVDKLYAASQAGVKIQLVVRGICILKARVPNLSENIEVISIVDRFLEHSRVFIFANAEEPKYFIGSADWMTRNLDNRIEVACPIYEPTIQKDLLTILDFQLSDNTHARILDQNSKNEYKKTRKKLPIRSQMVIHQYLWKYSYCSLAKRKKNI